VVRVTERILNSFNKTVEALLKVATNADDFDTFEVSGIAGTQMEDTLSFDVARWLIKRMRDKVEIAWENYDPGRELGTTGPRFIPFLEDDAYVEADTPWRRWLEAAAGKKRIPEWLIARFEQLPLPPQQKLSSTIHSASRCAGVSRTPSSREPATGSRFTAFSITRHR